MHQLDTKFPEAGEVLNRFNIGCAPCSVGTCLLKDIVEIHNISAEHEKELLKGLSEILYPGQDVKIPEIKRKNEATSGEIKYSPPLKKLVDEHVLIKRLIALIPEIAGTVDVKNDEEKQVVLDSVDFIKNYADKFHHAKEEDILFKYFDEDLDIVKVMLEDHTNARAHVKAILEAVDKEDNDTVKSHLIEYGKLLTEHIKREDEILYPWMDKNLLTTQVGEMLTSFNNVDSKFSGSSEKYEDLINKLEKKFKN